MEELKTVVSAAARESDVLDGERTEREKVPA